MQGDWILIVTGQIVDIFKRDVDKSGRNPKFFYEFRIRPDSIELPPGVASPPDGIAIRVKDVELHQLTSEPLAVNDRVVMTARGNGPRPTLFYLVAVTKLTAG